MLLAIDHRTRYSYEHPVQYGLQQVRLRPKDRAGQSIVAWDIDIQGGWIETAFDDQHNNHVDLVAVERGATETIIQCTGKVESTNGSGVIGQHGGCAPLWYFQRQTELTKLGKGIRTLAKQAEGDNDIARLHALSALVLDKVAYGTGRTDAETTAEDALAAGHGVCQDHAHIFIAAARYLGFPARYVSGYLMMNDRIDQDATHGWAEVHAEGVGWVGFDISNGYSPDERYVRVATGLDYSEAAPVRGVRYGPGDEDMIVTVQVEQ